MGVDVLWASAHVILLEATNPIAYGSFNLSMGSHGNRLWPIWGACQGLLSSAEAQPMLHGTERFWGRCSLPRIPAPSRNRV